MKTQLARLLACVRRRPVLSLLLGLLLFAPLGYGGYRAAQHFYIQHHLIAAEQATDRYDFDEAECHLAACLWAKPQSAVLHLQMARVARRADHFKLAEEHLQKCRQIEGRTPENALEALLLRAQGGDIADVENLLLEQVNLNSPDSNLILEAMAKGYIIVYHLDGARGCLNRLLERQPDNISALLWRASLWRTAGNYTGAVEDCRHAVEAQPNHRAARLRLGETLLITEQPAEALRQYEYLRQQPGGEATEILLGLARCHHQLGHTETARQLLEEVLARDPHDGFAVVERGKLALEMESPVAAEKWLRQAVADYPFDATSNYLLAQALQKQGKEEESRPYFAARTRIENDLKALQLAFQRVVKKPNDPEPRLEAGRICLRNGRADEGERWLLSAVEQAPEHAAARSALAAFYERSGKTELAARYRRED
jgi:predicted Zn-dependent protease